MTKNNDKPLTENCKLCGNKIIFGKGFGYANIGSKEKSDFSVHVECLGLGPIIEDIQDNLNKILKDKNKQKMT